MQTAANCARVFAQYFKVTNVLIESRISHILDMETNIHSWGGSQGFSVESPLWLLFAGVPAEAAVEDMSEPKSVVVPSEAPLSELGFRRQLLKDGGEEKVVPAPGRNDESEKLRKSEEEAAEGALVALVSNRPVLGRKRRGRLRRI